MVLPIIFGLPLLCIHNSSHMQLVTYLFFCCLSAADDMNVIFFFFLCKCRVLGFYLVTDIFKNKDLD